MTRRNRLVFAVCLISLVAAVAVAGAAQSSVIISRVEGVSQMKPPTKVGLGPTKIKMTLARSDYTRLAVTGEIYNVYWDAGERVPPGTMVTFEYRTKKNKQTKFLFEKYEDPIRGEWITSFLIPSEEPVAEWRVRVVYGGKRLAETKSDTWR